MNTRKEKIMLVTRYWDASQLRKEFIRFDRDYFTYEAYEGFIELFQEFDCELDVIGLCCDFSEDDAAGIVERYSNLEQFAECADESGDIDETKLEEALNYYTLAIKLNNGCYLYQDF